MLKSQDMCESARCIGPNFSLNFLCNFVTKLAVRIMKS